jgi:enoyl-CoA hydratase/carnithine racemase
MPDYIDLEQRGAVVGIRMNRPEKKNALTIAMYEAMTEAVRQAERDEGVRVIVFLGAEGCFTAGNDLNDFLQSPPTGPESPVMQFLVAISTAEKPLVAAVDGLAIGIGTTMLLHCDLVYASRNARFRLPFVSLGLTPEAGASLLLPHLAGYHRAAELLLLGDVFDANEAAAMGLVSAAFDPSDLEAEALGRAERLARQPRESVRMTKVLLKQGMAEAVQRRIAEEGQVFLQRLASPEAAAAMRAFVEKRGGRE